MTDQPHYPYADGDIAVLGPEVFASADGQTINWKGSNYSRHPDEIHCLCGGINVVHEIRGAGTPHDRTSRSDTADSPLRKQITDAIQAVQDRQSAPVEVGDERIVDAVMAVILQLGWQLGDRARDAEAALERVRKVANSLMAMGGVPEGAAATAIHIALDQPAAHDDGPSVAECAKDDDRWWNGEREGE